MSAAPRNPPGTIAWAFALQRFREAKWQGHNPREELAELWWHALSIRKWWKAVPVSSPARRSRSARSRRLGKTRRATEATIGTVDRWFYELSHEALAFLQAFRSGALTAVGPAGNAVERERWELASMRSGGALVGVYDEADLFVDEEALTEWVSDYPRPVGARLPEHQVAALRILQALVQLGVIGAHEGEWRARRWGYPGLDFRAGAEPSGADAPFIIGETVDERDPYGVGRYRPTKKAGRPNTRNVIRHIADERRKRGEAAIGRKAEAAAIVEIMTRLLPLGWTVPTEKHVYNQLAADIEEIE